MFGISKINQLQQIKFKTYKEGLLLPILPSDDLLQSARYQALVMELRKAINISDQDFRRYYLPTIHRFAEFVQLIPRQFKGALGGLLSEALARAILSIHYYIDEHQGEAVSSLRLYALTTAALFSDISHTVCNQVVIITDEIGTYISEWNPFAGSMKESAGDFYRMYERHSSYQRLQGSIGAILARQLLPEAGFLWLTSDLAIFSEWLDALSDDSRRGGGLRRALSHIKIDDLLELLGSLGQITQDFIQPEADQYGEAFFQWLKDGIDKGNIPVNGKEAQVHVVADGVFLERQLFKQFAEVTKLPVNSNIVFAQFGNLLGIASKGGGDFLNAQYFSQDTANVSKTSSGLLNKSDAKLGMVVSDSTLLLSTAAYPVDQTLSSISKKEASSSASDEHRSAVQFQPKRRD